MSTTLLFVELIVIGLQVTLWLALVVLLFFGHGWLNLSELVKWQTTGTLILLAFAYTIGTLFDRLTNRIFSRLNEGLKTREFPDPPAALVAIRYAVAKENEYLNRLFEYTRSRMRIARATAINAPIISLLLLAYYFIRMNTWTLETKFAIGAFTVIFGLLMAVLAVHAWDKLMTTYIKLVRVNLDLMNHRAIRENSDWTAEEGNFMPNHKPQPTGEDANP